MKASATFLLSSRETDGQQCWSNQLWGGILQKITPIVKGSVKYYRANEQTPGEGGEGLGWLLCK